MILALDPSSTRTGYALVRPDATLVEAGVLTGGDPKKVPAIARIDEISRGLADLLREHAPDQIVIEVPSGHVAGRLKRVSPAGQATYGMAVGALREVCKRHMGESARPIDVFENDWTRRIPKERRAAAIAAMYPAAAGALAKKDRGHDAADAIGLALWWIEQTTLRRGRRFDCILIDEAIDEQR